ncbi:pilus assembly FimT family protein [Campylobacter majalis]|uniref:pilus assembly FimT family protein n=1 Tax=Campylobacter majalis TaxID=2790656 RepID=UPI003D69C3BB
MKFRAFTLFEVVFVLIIISILGVLAIPKSNQDNLRAAAYQVMSHIRYAQNLAFLDNTFKPNSLQNRQIKWSFVFANTAINTKSCQLNEKNKQTWKYSVYKDLSLNGNLNSRREVAANPSKINKVLSGGWSGISKKDCKLVSSELDIQKKYGVTNVKLLGHCATKQTRSFGFDNGGRPTRIASTTSKTNKPVRLLKNDCKIILSNASSSITILVKKRTGLVCIESKQEKGKCEKRPSQTQE